MFERKNSLPQSLSLPKTDHPSFKPEWIVKSLAGLGDSRTNQENAMLARFLAVSTMRSLTDVATGTLERASFSNGYGGPWVAVFTDDALQAQMRLASNKGGRSITSSTTCVEAMLMAEQGNSLGLAIDPFSEHCSVVLWQSLREQYGLYKMYSGCGPSRNSVSPVEVLPAIWHPDLIAALKDKVHSSPGIACALLALTGKPNFPRAGTLVVDCIESSYDSFRREATELMDQFRSTFIRSDLPIGAVRCCDEALLGSLMRHGATNLLA